MSEEPLTRREILAALRQAMEGEPYVHAMWEGGSEAFGRTDEWSDIDLQFDVDDERVADAIARVEAALSPLSPIRDRLERPLRPETGYHQVFYRFEKASEFLLLDLCVFRHSHEDKFLAEEIHGRAVFHFNKGGALSISHLDVAAQMEKIRARQAQVRNRFAMFACMVDKELNRRNWIAAVDLYSRLVLDSLVDVLRMRLSPAHFDFKVPYLNHDLPQPVFDRLREFFVRDPEDLRAKYVRASSWLQEEMSALDLDAIEERLRSS